MTKARFVAVLFSVSLLSTPALAQDYVDQKVQELFGQGYTHFEISRGVLRTEIEAYGPAFTKLELVISNTDGSVISESTEVQTQDEFLQKLDDISQSGDDDGNDNGEGSTVDANDDNSGGSSIDANDYETGDDNGGSSFGSSDGGSENSNGGTSSDESDGGSESEASGGDDNGRESGDNEQD